MEKRNSAPVSNIDFDDYSNTYREVLKSSLKGFGNNAEFFDELKIYSIKKWVIKESRRYEILDFGCGIGKLTALLASNFRNSNIYGYDISAKSLSTARKESSGLDNIYFLDNLPESPAYDIIIAANIFHHILPGERELVLHKIKKLLRPQGRILVFEHNPFNPLTRYIVNHCPFDKGAKLISLGEFLKIIKSLGLNVELKNFVLFFPWPARVFRTIESLLKRVPAGAQYFLVAAEK